MARKTQTKVIITQNASSSSQWEPLIGVGSTIEIKIKPYDEIINFGIWQRWMRGILIPLNLQLALLGLKKKPQEMSEDQCNKIDKKAITVIEMWVCS